MILITLPLEMHGQRCEKCHKDEEKAKIMLEKCPSCSYAYYCSETCRTDDFENHVYSGDHFENQQDSVK